MRTLLPLVLLAACSQPTSTLRYAAAPPVWRVGDRIPLAKQPAERDYNRTLYHTDGFVVRRATRAMDVPDPVRAQDVNSLDEVPDSTWFTNRIGIREIPPDELERGANIDPSPLEHLPWTITGAKVGGTALGFVIEDTKGDKYLMKFDQPARPEMETGAHMMGHAIVWAAGYNVPQDYIGSIRPSDIKISPKANKKDSFGKKTPITQEDFDLALKQVAFNKDGSIRVLASRYLSGMPIGPYAREGTRGDDPNDKIRHEQRRSLRGQVALFSWFNHTDMQEDNSLDVFIKHKGPDGKPGEQGHVVHYLIDWGKAFGVMGWGLGWRTVGYTYRVDIAKMLSSLVTLGLRERPWDDVSAPAYVGLGLFEAKHFDPGEWRTNSPYWPYEDSDRFDGYWGAKLVMRFSRTQIEAIVGQAQFSDPRTVTYMIETLLERQRRIGAYWFRQVSPFDAFSLESVAGATRLCFDDLGQQYGLELVRASKLSSTVYDAARKTLRPTVTIPSPGTRACVEVPIAATPDGYTVVKLAAKRNAQALPPVFVHLARDASGELAVVGIRRE